MSSAEDCRLVLSLIPDEYIINDICLAAVKQNGSAFQFVPHEFRTPETCVTAYMENKEFADYLYGGGRTNMKRKIQEYWNAKKTKLSKEQVRK